MSQRSTNNPQRNERGPYGGTPYEVTPLAPSLGVKESPGEVIEALKQLCTSFFIRYGIGPRDPECAQALELPRSDIFRERPNGVARHAVFEDLLGRLSLPAKDMLAFGDSAAISLPNIDQMQLWKKQIADLSAEHKSFLRIPPDIGQAFPQHSLATALNPSLERSDSNQVIGLLTRQLTLFHKHGSEWTRITPAESEHLSHIVIALNTSSLPDSELARRLSQYGLVLQQSKTTKKFGPAFEYSSRKNGTLFDMSSYYFRDLIDKKDPGSRLPLPQRNKLKSFLHELQEAVRDKELGTISPETWRQRQAAAFKRLLRAP